MIEFDEFEGIFDGIANALRAGSNSMNLRAAAGQWQQVRTHRSRAQAGRCRDRHAGTQARRHSHAH